MSNIQIKLTEFSDLITRYTADFVGREWLVKQVTDLLDDRECRIVVLTGGPGVGKTAFLAHLAATHPRGRATLSGATAVTSCVLAMPIPSCSPSAVSWLRSIPSYSILRTWKWSSANGSGM
jgi:hypothetical protein